MWKQVQTNSAWKVFLNRSQSSVCYLVRVSARIRADTLLKTRLPKQYSKHYHHHFINKNDEWFVNIHGWLLYDQSPNMRNRFSWLGSLHSLRSFKSANSHLTLNTILIGYQYSTHCHCESTFFLYANSCHCNIHLTFSNTPFYSIINKWQLSIKTITRPHKHITIAHTSTNMFPRGKMGFFRLLSFSQH